MNSSPGKARTLRFVYLNEHAGRYFRKDLTATAIADYGVRARPGAPVALPLDWKELKTLKSASQFTMKDVLKRLRDRKPESVSKDKQQFLPAP